MSSIGQLISDHAKATRIKYGRYPAVERSWDSDSGAIVEKPCVPLPGHEKDVIESLDFDTWSEIDKAMTPMNREDYRRRLRKILTRRARLYNYTRDLRNRVNSTRAVNYIGSE